MFKKQSVTVPLPEFEWKEVQIPVAISGSTTTEKERPPKPADVPNRIVTTIEPRWSNGIEYDENGDSKPDLMPGVRWHWSVSHEGGEYQWQFDAWLFNFHHRWQAPRAHAVGSGVASSEIEATRQAAVLRTAYQLWLDGEYKPTETTVSVTQGPRQ